MARQIINLEIPVLFKCCPTSAANPFSRLDFDWLILIVGFELIGSLSWWGISLCDPSWMKK